jgi:hypothetical protein
MSTIKNIVTLLMTAFFFLTSSGIVLQHHYCNEEGLTTQFLFPVEHACKQNVEIQSCTANQCCKLSENVDLPDDYPALEKESCCYNETEYIHLDEDYTVTYAEWSFVSPLELVSYDPSITPILQFNYFDEIGRAPPLSYSLSTKLALLQYYLI